MDRGGAADESVAPATRKLRQAAIASSPSAMSTGLARNWWAIGLRGVATVLFGLSILVLPPLTIASLVLLFATYVVADGAFAILAGARAARRGQRWWTLIVEGLTNLALAAAVLVWPVVGVVPFVRLASAWAVVTGALMLAAARRLSGSHGRWLLAFAGAASAAWGALAAAVGPSSAGGLRTVGLWLVAYALLFGATLLLLAFRLMRRHGEAGSRGPPSPATGHSGAALRNGPARAEMWRKADAHQGGGAPPHHNRCR